MQDIVVYAMYLVDSIILNNCSYSLHPPTTEPCSSTDLESSDGDKALVASRVDAMYLVVQNVVVLQYRESGGREPGPDHHLGRGRAKLGARPQLSRPPKPEGVHSSA